ncbi:hypothetical protein NL676_005695 [Syzygium grande]|nr:hypothetical protein NL676_005695 [Syzygium grande]
MASPIKRVVHHAIHAVCFLGEFGHRSHIFGLARFPGGCSSASASRRSSLGRLHPRDRASRYRGVGTRQGKRQEEAVLKELDDVEVHVRQVLEAIDEV